MSFRRIAVVMAGGSGTRFWPVSKPDRPKQFLHLADPSKSLLQQAVERIAPVVGQDVMIATAESMVGASRTVCTTVDPDNVIGEPYKRNTLGALVWSTANLVAKNEDWQNISVAVLTADHMIRPDESFCECVETALQTAESRSCLVTIGIKPTRPATEFGYISLGEETNSGVFSVGNFVEKPDVESAKRYIGAGYLWNSGMFFWTLAAFRAQLYKHCPEADEAISEIAEHIKCGRGDAAASVFEKLTSNSVDYALMEKADSVSVVASTFDWDDLGSWDALERTADSSCDNVTVGESRLIDSEGCIVYNDCEDTTINVLGMKDIVVVVTDGQVMVCPKDRAQDVRKFSD